MPSRPGAARAVSDHTLWVLRGKDIVEITIEKGDSDGLHTIILAGEVQAGDQVITDMIEGQ